MLFSFLKMSTLFRRLLHYCNQNKFPLLPQDVRFELGRKVNNAFRESEHNKTIVFKIKIQEPEGEFEAVSYPRKFQPTIDKIIEDYFKEHSPPPKKERKRIPIKSKPAYDKHKNNPNKRRYR